MSDSRTQMVLWSMTHTQVRVIKIRHGALSILYWPPTNISRYGVIYREDQQISRKEYKITETYKN